MKNELLLLRHGKSDWSCNSADFYRPLKQRGIRESAKIGAWLKSNNLIPDCIVSSPAKRAKQTAQQVCDATELLQENIIWNDDVYMADVQKLINVIAAMPPSTCRLMLVGHNPGLEELLLYLCKDFIVDDKAEKVLPTATYVLLESSVSWAEIAESTFHFIEMQRGRYL